MMDIVTMIYLYYSLSDHGEILHLYQSGLTLLVKILFVN